MRRLLACFFLFSAPFCAQTGLSLAIEYPALERILAQQLFTQDGRKYVRGAPQDRCSYAYLEHPKIGAGDGRLRVFSRFSGRSAAGLFSRCIGLGDDFEVVITATPLYRDGKIVFDNVRVETPNRDGFYIRHVKTALAATLTHDFRYAILDDARRLLEEQRPHAPFTQKVQNFRVTAVSVTPTALVLSIDLTLLVH